jgi:hypothetical protein
MVGDASREELVRLLDAFLSGTQGVELRSPISAFEELPDSFRTSLQRAAIVGQIWTAWSTDEGCVAAWGDYDREQSLRIRAHVLLIEWCRPPAEHHKSWWHCYANRPREWICGRGRS